MKFACDGLLSLRCYAFAYSVRIYNLWMANFPCIPKISIQLKRRCHKINNLTFSTRHTQNMDYFLKIQLNAQLNGWKLLFSTAIWVNSDSCRRCLNSRLNWPVSTINWIVLMGKKCANAVKESDTVCCCCYCCCYSAGEKRKIKMNERKNNAFVLGFCATRTVTSLSLSAWKKFSQQRRIGWHARKKNVSMCTERTAHVTPASCLALTQPNSHLHFFPFIDNFFVLLVFFSRLDRFWVMFVH